MTLQEKLARFLRDNPHLAPPFIQVALDYYAQSVSVTPDKEIVRLLQVIKPKAWKETARLWQAISGTRTSRDYVPPKPEPPPEPDHDITEQQRRDLHNK